jgi:hypothetical protein
MQTVNIYEDSLQSSLIGPTVVPTAPTWRLLRHRAQLYSSDAGLDVRRGDTTTRGGQVFVDALSRARGWNLYLGYVRDATLGWLDQLEAAAAQGRNILVVQRIGHARAASESVFGLLNPGRRGFASVNGRSWSATISERL